MTLGGVGYAAHKRRRGGNPYYTQFFLRVLDEGRRLLRLYYQSFDDRLPQEYVEEHEAIIAGLRAHDPAQAEQAMRLHLRELLNDLPEIERSRPEIFLP